MVKWSFNKMEDVSVTHRESGEAADFETAKLQVEGYMETYGRDGSSGLVWSDSEAEVCEPTGGALNWSPCGVPSS